MIDVFTNPPLTGKPGRPRTTHCKRGHKRSPNIKHCPMCRSLLERRKYAENAKFRARKLAYKQWYTNGDAQGRSWEEIRSSL